MLYIFQVWREYSIWLKIQNYFSSRPAPFIENSSGFSSLRMPNEAGRSGDEATVKTYCFGLHSLQDVQKNHNPYLVSVTPQAGVQHLKHLTRLLCIVLAFNHSRMCIAVIWFQSHPSKCTQFRWSLGKYNLCNT